MLADLLNREWISYVPPTVSTHLGYLMPERKYLPWMVTKEGTTAETISQLVKSVDAYGIPFMRSSASPQAMVERLSSFDYTTADSRLHCRWPIS